MRKIAINLETEKRNASRSLPVKFVLLIARSISAAFRLKNYYPVDGAISSNRGIQGFRRHWLRGCKHIGASARPAPFPILFPIRSGKITFAQFVEFLQKY